MYYYFSYAFDVVQTFLDVYISFWCSTYRHFHKI